MNTNSNRHSLQHCELFEITRDTAKGSGTVTSYTHQQSFSKPHLVKAVTRSQRAKGERESQQSNTHLSLRYRIRAREMSPQLRAEIASILRTLRAHSKRRHTTSIWVSARGAVLRFQELCGFAEKVLKIGRIYQLRQVLTEDVVRSFVSWQLNKPGGNKIVSVANQIRRIKNVLLFHPVLGDVDFSWMTAIIGEYGSETPSERTKRREEGELPYEELATIPAKIRARRKELRSASARTLAWYVHDELLMLWMVAQPFYPGLIRALRVSGSSKTLFKEAKPTDDPPFRISPWVERRLKGNPEFEFWQYCFDTRQTSGRGTVRGQVVRRLVQLLESYLNVHRPNLARNATDTLFLNRVGGPMSCMQLIQLVGNICEEFTDVRVNPSAFRRIFALYWLKVNPGDYEGLAAILAIGLPYAMQEYDPEYDEWHPKRLTGRR
jgi:hypothetical protein